MKKPFIVILALVIVLGIAVGISKAVPTTGIEEETGGGDRMMSIEDYVRINISELSPEKEVLGGTFYVTDIVARDGEGTVSYEDGHNAYTADFTYTIDERTGITIDSFDIRE